MSRHQRGITMIELMIALAIGLFITAVLIITFSASNSLFNDLRKSRDQIENGRFALEQVSEEIRHAGYFGELSVFTAPTAAVDVCAVPTLQHLFNPIEIVSTALNAKATPLPSCLASDEVAVGSDVVVVRRAGTIPLAVGSMAVNGALYLQATTTEAQIQVGNGVALAALKKADGADTTLFQRNGAAATIHPLHVAIYYVSPCSQATCGASGGDGIRTLKRIELSAPGNTATWSAPIPLVSGIEYLQVDIGADTAPAAVSAVTTQRGDGVAESFTSTLPAGSAWNEVVSARVFVLSRSTEIFNGHDDSDRTYALGAQGSVAGTGAFKRQVFSAEVRVNNVAGRRETDPRD